MTTATMTRFTRSQSTALDVEAIRADFPILQRRIHGLPLVYLDNAATSQKPQAVIDALTRYYENTNANVHRGVHTLSEEATAQYEGARAKVSSFIGACCPKEVIWTRNATEAINLVAYSWGRANLKRGDRVLLTEMEHHSNLVPWQILSAEIGFEIDYLRLADDGTLILDDLPRLLTPRTKLFGFTYMSNVLGTINPVQELIQAAHKAGALVLLDACQAVPHMPVDVQVLDVDFMAFSGHKMLGPTGIGALWGRRELLNAMPPFMGGGDMIREVHLSGFKPSELPWKFEAGTPAIAQAIGLGAAVDYLSSVGMEAVRQAEREITAHAMERLREVKGLRIMGSRAEQRGGLVAFTLDAAHPHDIAAVLDNLGIAVRAGHHCAQPLHERYNIPASARASFYLYNQKEEVDLLVKGLKQGCGDVQFLGGNMDLYAEEILDHYKHPRHYGHLDDPTLVYHDRNPLCGDEIELELKIEDGKVADVAYTGHGCAIGRAAASMMSEEIIGKSLDELRGWNKESILDLLGIEVGPVRLKCALLPLKALKSAVWGLAEDAGE